jgi:transposase
VAGTPARADAGWARAAPSLPANGRRGGHWQDHRAVLGGILWVMRTSAPWRELPAEFGAWKTAHSHYQHWRDDGLWEVILTRIQPPAGGVGST